MMWVCRVILAKRIVRQGESVVTPTRRRRRRRRRRNCPPVIR